MRSTRRRRHVLSAGLTATLAVAAGGPAAAATSPSIVMPGTVCHGVTLKTERDEVLALSHNDVVTCATAEQVAHNYINGMRGPDNFRCRVGHIHDRGAIDASIVCEQDARGPGRVYIALKWI